MAGESGAQHPDWAALGSLKEHLKQQLRPEGVVVVEHVVAFSPPFTAWVWLGTATDRARDALRADAGLRERVRRVAEEVGLENLVDGVHVESQETVDRDYEGLWSHAMR